jgi:hypothetical protein
MYCIARSPNIANTASKLGISFFASSDCVGAGDTKAETVGDGVAAGVGVIAEAGAASDIPCVTVNAGDAVGVSVSVFVAPYPPPEDVCVVAAEVEPEHLNVPARQSTATGLPFSSNNSLGSANANTVSQPSSCSFSHLYRKRTNQVFPRKRVQCRKSKPVVTHVMLSPAHREISRVSVPIGHIHTRGIVSQVYLTALEVCICSITRLHRF